jgi:hypothetical protein
LDVLLMLLFLLSLTVLIFSSLVYEVERRQYSTYDPTVGALVCPLSWRCVLRVQQCPFL